MEWRLREFMINLSKRGLVKDQLKTIRQSSNNNVKDVRELRHRQIKISEVADAGQEEFRKMRCVLGAVMVLNYNRVGLQSDRRRSEIPFTAI